MIEMLKQKKQLELNFSRYFEIYNIVIKSDNFWKQLNNMVDFPFVYEELKNNYNYETTNTCRKLGITIQDRLHSF